MHRVRASLWAVACTAVITAGMALLPVMMAMGAATETPVNVRLTDVRLADIRQVIAAACTVRYEEEYAAVCPQGRSGPQDHHLVRRGGGRGEEIPLDR